MNFDVAIRKITTVTLHTQTVRDSLGEISITDALNLPTNNVPFRSDHVYTATASFALFQAVMPPTTLETFRKPNCSKRLDPIDERYPPAQMTATFESRFNDKADSARWFSGMCAAFSICPAFHSGGRRTSMIVSTEPSSIRSCSSWTEICSTIASGNPA